MAKLNVTVIDEKGLTFHNILGIDDVRVLELEKFVLILCNEEGNKHSDCTKICEYCNNLNEIVYTISFYGYVCGSCETAERLNKVGKSIQLKFGNGKEIN